MTSTIVCDVCPRACKLEEGETGYCNVRKNENGKNVDALYGLFYPFPEEYNEVSAPGSYTVVFPGCNLKCWFCCVPFVSSQFTGDVSRWPTGVYRELSPREFAEKAKKSAGPNRGGYTCGMAGFFGGEPSLHFEYIIEASRVCHELGCISKLHTNGYVNEWVMTDLSHAMDVISINVKGSASQAVYQRMGADPTVILQSIKVDWKNRPFRIDPPSHMINTIIGPGMEPTVEENARFGKWLATETSPHIQVVVEPLMEAKDHFVNPKTEGSGFWPGDTEGKASVRVFSAARALTLGGLTNVNVLMSGGNTVRVPAFLGSVGG